MPRLSPDGSTLANGGINLRKFSTSTKDDGTAATQPYGRFRYFGSSDPASEVKICWVTQWDTVRSVMARDGDPRIIAGRKSIVPADNLFTTLPSYSDETATMSHSLIEAASHPLYGSTRGRLVANAGYFRADTYPSPSAINTISLSAGAINAGSGLRTTTWDMDVPYNGVALCQALAPSKAATCREIGTMAWATSRMAPTSTSRTKAASSATVPPNRRISGQSNYRDVTSATFFSPNRQIPSAVMFGSLPSGVKANKPWQTLLFRPTPAGHPGLSSPRDHLLLDFSICLVVEPYAISEPLSTAGRINMNWSIEPFSYIRRDTGLRAVMAKERLLAVPLNVAAAYKDNGDPPVNAIPRDLRHDIDLAETLRGFEHAFAAGDVFRSPSEICDIHLVPKGQTYAGMGTFWNNSRSRATTAANAPTPASIPASRRNRTPSPFTSACKLSLLSGTAIRRADGIQYRQGRQGDRRISRLHHTRNATWILNRPGLPDFVRCLPHSMIPRRTLTRIINSGLSAAKSLPHESALFPPRTPRRHCHHHHTRGSDHPGHEFHRTVVFPQRRYPIRHRIARSRSPDCRHPKSSR